MATLDQTLNSHSRKVNRTSVWTIGIIAVAAIVAILIWANSRSSSSQLTGVRTTTERMNMAPDSRTGVTNPNGESQVPKMPMNNTEGH